MCFYEQFYGFHALRTVGKCTSRHLFRYGGLIIDYVYDNILASLGNNGNKISRRQFGFYSCNKQYKASDQASHFLKDFFASLQNLCCQNLSLPMRSFALIYKIVISLILINATFISWEIPIQSLDVRFLASYKRTFQGHLKQVRLLLLFSKCWASYVKNDRMRTS